VSGTLPIANGGTNATSAADARTNLDVPTRTGGNASGTWGISVTGNAATATTATNQSGGTVNATTGTFSNQLVINYNIAAPANYYNALQQEIRATSGTAGIGLHRAGFSHCGIYHDASDTLKFNMNSGTVTLNASIGTVIGSGNYNSYAPTLTGGGASGTWGISVTGSAASLNSSNSIARTGSSGNLNTDFNNTPAGTGRYQGDDAGLANSPGNTWWIYENKRHSNSSNSWGTQVAWGWEDNANRLATRNVQAGSFGAWVYYLNSSNYTSYAPSLTGSGASGTWGISISGNSANTSSISNAVGGSYQWTGTNHFKSNQNTSGSNAPLQAFSDNGGGAIMSFHRGGAFAVNFGLDSDNVMRIGGWSAAPNLWQLDMSGNNTLKGAFTSIYTAASGTFPVVIGAGGGLPVDRGILLQASSGSSIPLYFTVNSGGTVSGSVIASGGTTAYNTSSDYRMKENIRDLDVLAAVNKIMSIRPRVFDWKEECGGKKNSVGFIAHELQEYAPECVDGEKDRVHSDGAIFPQGVDSSWLIPSISAMLQEHQKVIEQLKAEIALLKGI
jgi:hypothetical protein